MLSADTPLDSQFRPYINPINSFQVEAFVQNLVTYCMTYIYFLCWVIPQKERLVSQLFYTFDYLSE